MDLLRTPGPGSTSGRGPQVVPTGMAEMPMPTFRLTSLPSLSDFAVSRVSTNPWWIAKLLRTARGPKVARGRAMLEAILIIQEGGARAAISKVRMLTMIVTVTVTDSVAQKEAGMVESGGGEAQPNGSRTRS